MTAQQNIYIEVTGEDYAANRKLLGELIALVEKRVEVGLYIYEPDERQQRRYLKHAAFEPASYLASSR